MKQYENILKDLLELSEKVFPDQHKQIEEKAKALLNEYCKPEQGKAKEITMHTVKRIFPCIAFYKAVSECTNQQKQASSIIETYFTRECELVAKKLQKLCRIPFVYKFVPCIMAGIIHKAFGVKSGFEMIDRNVNGKGCHIDMIQCPYFQSCSRFGCPELTTVFCNSDDITYGNMHPKLSWERKKTLGRGDECCDFILKIKK